MLNKTSTTLLRTDLTPANWDAETAGKTVFIKFFAPWCGHCKKMKPAWDALMKEYKGHETKLIAEVDCTADGKPLCDANSVRGFPTLKYGDPSDLQDYEGGREAANFKAHAEKELNPACSPKNIDLCDDVKKAEIKKFQAMDDAALETEIKAKEAELEKVEADFKEQVSGLQSQYEGFMKAKDEGIAAVKASGLGLMKAVKASKGKGKDEL